MIDRLRWGVLPFYLLLCVVFGGSTQGIYSLLALQLTGIALIVWAVARRGAVALPRDARTLVWIGAGVALLFLFQLIPLPPGIWAALPGQGQVAEGYRLLGQAAPWRPLSLVPDETIATAVTLIPPLAVLCFCLLTDDVRPSWIAATVLAATVASVVLGALQVGSSSGGAPSPWYFYRQSNFGQATGFFANSNHMGSLLMISIPFLAAMVRRLRVRRSAKVRAGALLLAAAGLVVIAVGIALNRSLAVLLLVAPVSLLSAIIVAGEERRRLRKPLMLGAMAAAVLAFLASLTSLPSRIFTANAVSFESRREMWATSLKAIGDYFPFGSGIGSFTRVYDTYEDPAEVGRTIVNHAHNDYLEIALEAGLPGIVLTLVLVLWWLRRASAVWRPDGRSDMAMAAAIASGALLLHSIVDFPLRMPALSAIMAACLALLTISFRDHAKKQDIWSTRHVSV
ncbi:MAG TPA: O-antigen ligase family protein [Sphingomicrobium sp.]|nr:O-antigen ligase family protein [Sphingomicrobium sp.]